MRIVGRKFTHDEFKVYLSGLNIPNWARFITVHNTSEPSVALYNRWTQKPGWTPEQWMKNLVSYYSSLGWHGTPHLFIPPTYDTILVLNSLDAPGVHTPSWNQFSIGVETVGEFETEDVPHSTMDNLVFTLVQLHQKLGLRPTPFVLGEKGLHFHKEDPRTTHRQCPGLRLSKPALVNAVLFDIGTPVTTFPEHDEQGGHIHVPVASQEADTSGMSPQELTSTKWLQVMLNQWSQKQRPVAFVQLPVTGVHDNPTLEATRTFQLASGLNPDRIAGPVTRTALKKAAGG